MSEKFSMPSSEQGELREATLDIARSKLRDVRRYPIWVAVMDDIRYLLKRVNAVPEDIDATEEELQGLYREGCKMAAKEGLQEAEEIANMKEGWFATDKVRGFLQKGNLKPEDIGTTETRLVELEEIAKTRKSDWDD